MNSSSSSALRAGVAAALVVAALGLGGAARAQESLRPEVGKPLQAAQDMIKSGRYREALAKVREAEAVGARNANETFLIERMRIAAASGAGDVDTAARSFEALNGSPRVSSAEKVRMIESIAVGYYLGHWVDGKLGTGRWLSLVGFLIGCYAGFKALFRVAKQMQKDVENEEKLARGEDPWEKPEKSDVDV